MLNDPGNEQLDAALLSLMITLNEMDKEKDKQKEERGDDVYDRSCC